jgi:c-di-GMP-binding flagellar brake protein YcgR
MPNSTPAVSMFAEFGIEAPPTVERRTNPRVKIDVPARLKCLNPLTSIGPSIKARVTEISRGGMKIRANREFQTGGVVQVIVKDTFYMGTVRHCQRVEEGFETGLNLTESIRSSLL